MSYGKISTFIFLFNLIVGVGPLNLPFAFEASGLLLGSILLTLLAFLAFVAVTFVVEAISSANAVKYIGGEERLLKEEMEEEGNPFEIKKRIEITEMAEIFLGKGGSTFFLIAMAVYLYGDLSIYAIAVPKTLHHFSGDVFGKETYLVFVAIFAAFIVPFCFFSFTDTKYIQYGTMAARNSAFIMMIGCSLAYAVSPPSSVDNYSRNVPLFHTSGIGSIFGTAVYSFMCHHSIPGIIGPLKDKSALTWIFALDYIVILLANLLLCVSALVAFGNAPNSTCDSGSDQPCQIQDLFTLNFVSYHVKAIGDFLVLFPVFTLTSSFPLIAITLRNNLKDLGIKKRWIAAVCASFPPIIIAAATDNLGLVVSLTGSVGGVLIQFVVPAALVLASRKHWENNPVAFQKMHESPFKHKGWLYLLFVFSLISMALSLMYHIQNP